MIQMDVGPIEADAVRGLKANLDDLDRLPPNLNVAEQAVMSVATAFAANVTSTHGTKGTAAYVRFVGRGRSGPHCYMYVEMEADRYRCSFQVTADRFEQVFDRASKIAWFFIAPRLR